MRHYQTVNGARRVAIPRCPCRKTHPPLGSGRLPYVSMMKATDPPRPPAVRPLRRAAAQEQASARGHHRPKRGGIASGGSTGSSALPSRPCRHILRRSEARSALARWISALDTRPGYFLETRLLLLQGPPLLDTLPRCSVLSWGWWWGSSVRAHRFWQRTSFSDSNWRLRRAGCNASE